MHMLMEAKPVIKFVYGPIDRLCVASPAAAQFFDWYQGLWGI